MYVLCFSGSNQSDTGSAADRSGSTESNGDKKSTKPTRKISRFLVSPVVDRGEDVPEEKAERAPETKQETSDKHVEAKTERAKEPIKEVQVNGFPEPEPATPVPAAAATHAETTTATEATPPTKALPQSVPQEKFVPTHQYSLPAQLTHTPHTMIDHRPADMQQKPAEQIQQAPTITCIGNIPANIPQLPYQAPMNPALNGTIQPNLTTPLQIATDTPLLGLSQVGTPMGVGADLGLNIALGAVGPGFADPMGLGRLTLAQPMLTPTSGVTGSLGNAENIQRMLLKQNIIK